MTSAVKTDYNIHESPYLCCLPKGLSNDANKPVCNIVDSKAT